LISPHVQTIPNQVLSSQNIAHWLGRPSLAVDGLVVFTDGESMSTAIEAIQVFNPRHEELLVRVDELLDAAREDRARLNKTYVEIGIGLLAVKKSEAWKLRSHSWDGYVRGCEERFGKARTALYGYTSVAEQLGPHVAPKQLVAMGISKSQPLAAYVKTSGKKPSLALLDDALNPAIGVEEFRATLAKEQHLPADPKGKWRSIGFFCTDDEWEEIERAFALARREDEIDENLPETVVQFRTIAAMSKECISSWEGGRA
jgi:hypothetical protein